MFNTPTGQSLPGRFTIEAWSSLSPASQKRKLWAVKPDAKVT